MKVRALWVIAQSGFTKARTWRYIAWSSFRKARALCVIAESGFTKARTWRYIARSSFTKAIGLGVIMPGQVLRKPRLNIIFAVVFLTE